MAVADGRKIKTDLKFKFKFNLIRMCKFVWYEMFLISKEFYELYLSLKKHAKWSDLCASMSFSLGMSWGLLFLSTKASIKNFSK